MGPITSLVATSVAIDQIAILINSGADLIESEDLDGAVCCFTEVLAASRHATKQTVETDRNAMIPDESTFDQLIYIAPCAAGRVDISMSAECRDFVIFSRPIRMRDDILLAHQGTDSVIELIATVALFNLALARHLSACSMGSRHTGFRTLLKNVLELYEVAVALQRVSVLWPCGVFLSMAIMNNMSHAYSCLGNVELADQCCRRLLSVLMLFLDNQGFETFPLHSNLDCFFRSTHKLIFTSELPVAEAA